MNNRQGKKHKKNAEKLNFHQNQKPENVLIEGGREHSVAIFRELLSQKVPKMAFWVDFWGKHFFGLLLCAGPKISQFSHATV